MLGYLINSKIGAWSYTIFHHKGVAILLYLIELYSDTILVQLIGVMLFSHACFDRVSGYGLKYKKVFKYMHLGDL